MMRVPVRGKYGSGYTLVDSDLADSLPRPLYAKPNGYVYFQAREAGKLKNIYLHRHVCEAEPGMDVDHINGCKYDNRRANLRQCTRSQNMANLSRKGKGVRQNGEKWIAYIMKNYKARHIGTFDTEQAALEAYRRAALEEFGEYANAYRGRG